MSNWNARWRRVYMKKLSCGRELENAASVTRFWLWAARKATCQHWVRATPSFGRPSQEAGRLTGDWRLVYIK